MAIPDHQTLMLPVLNLASDEAEHKFSQAVEELANKFSLTQESDSRRYAG
jgi:restriction system protein